MSNYNFAADLACRLHAGQKRKTGEDYIYHPFRVAASLDDETDKIVALLHDTIEDTPITYETLRKLFDDEVADTVYTLSRWPDESYTSFIVRIKDNERATRVKIADINDNLRPGAEHLRDRYLKALTILQGE